MNHSTPARFTSFFGPYPTKNGDAACLYTEELNDDKH